jgi:hypothetical protein
MLNRSQAKIAESPTKRATKMVKLRLRIDINPPQCFSQQNRCIFPSKYVQAIVLTLKYEQLAKLVFITIPTSARSMPASLVPLIRVHLETAVFR